MQVISISTQTLLNSNVTSHMSKVEILLNQEEQCEFYRSINLNVYVSSLDGVWLITAKLANDRLNKKCNAKHDISRQRSSTYTYIHVPSMYTVHE